MQTNPPSSPQEIDPAFRDQCTDVYQRWTKGEIPFKAAMAQMIGFESEAGAAQQFANQAVAENYIGMIYGYRGDLDQSIRHFARSRDLFERANAPKRVLNSTLNLGESYRQKGDFPRARQFFRTAYEKGIELEEFTVSALAASNEGDMLVSMSNWDLARERHLKALELAPKIERADSRAMTLCQSNQGLATCSLQLNDPAAAWRYAQEAMRLARENDSPLMMGTAYRTLGEVLTVLGYTPDGARVEPPPMEDSDTAATNEHFGDPDMYFQLSIECFKKLQAEGETARTIYMQGLSLARRGQKVTASRKFQQATLMFTRLGMRDDANKAAQAQMDSQ